MSGNRGVFLTCRRSYVDLFLKDIVFRGHVLDIGGKKEGKRGAFRPNLESVDSWTYLNIDQSTHPDIVGSADNIELSDSSIDHVVLIEVLEHLKNPEQAIKECHRILKQEGRVSASMPFLVAVHADPDDFQRWTASKIVDVFTATGFSSVSVRPMGGIVAVTFDLVNSVIKNRKDQQGLLCRLVTKALRKIGPIILKLDQKYFPNDHNVNTGWFIEAKK